MIEQDSDIWEGADRSEDNMRLQNETPCHATIHVIDDDQAIRLALDSLLRSVGYCVKLYSSASEFMAASLGEEPACLILDVRLPGISGLELQSALTRQAGRLPIILMSGFGDVRMTVQGMKAGAVDFLEKPFRDQEMLDAVATAIAKWQTARAEGPEHQDLWVRFQSLTRREREVMQLICSGHMNKQIAGALAIQLTTVKFHRSAVMSKMGAKSIAELTRMAALLEVHRIKS